MSADEPAGPPRWEEDPPDQPLARVAAAVTATLADHPDGGEDLHAIVVLHDGHGTSAAGMYGYGSEPVARGIADYVKFGGNLFAASGIKMTLRLTKDGEEEPLAQYESPLAESEPGQPEAELIISGMVPTEAMTKACRVVTSALEHEEILAGSKVVIIVGLSERTNVLMHHGYGDTHEVVHTLLSALMQADDGGHLMMIPLGGHPN